VRKILRQPFPKPRRNIPQIKPVMHNDEQLHHCENLTTESARELGRGKNSHPARSKEARNFSTAFGV